VIDAPVDNQSQPKGRKLL